MTFNPSVENSLERADDEIRRLESSLAELTRLSRTLREASKGGDFKALRSLTTDIHAAIAQLPEIIGSLQALAAFPIELYMSDGKYIDELLSLAHRAGLQEARKIDRQMMAFPMNIGVEAAESKIRFKSKLSSQVRPKRVIEQILEERKGASKRNTKGLIDSLEASYLSCTGNKLSIPVPLSRIYETLTLLPGVSKLYDRLDFVIDLLALEQSGPRRTKRGNVMSLPANTSLTGSQPFMRIVSEDCIEHVYSSIRFDASAT